MRLEVLLRLVILCYDTSTKCVRAPKYFCKLRYNHKLYQEERGGGLCKNLMARQDYKQTIIVLAGLRLRMKPYMVDTCIPQDITSLILTG